MGVLRGLAVGVGTLGLIAVSAAPAAADSVTVNSVAVETAVGADTVTFTTVGTQWTLGSTQLTFLTDICGEEHCEFTGTFSADNGQGSGVTGTFSSSLVVDGSTGVYLSDVTVAFTVTGGFGAYTGAAGLGQLSAKGACYNIVCSDLVGTQQFQFTTPPPAPPAGPPTGKSHGNNGHHNGGRGHSGK